MAHRTRGFADAVLSRRGLVAALGLGAASVLAAGTALAQDAHGGGGGGGGGGGHSGESGDDGRNGAGRTPQQRALRHRARTGQTLGGGESADGHGGLHGSGRGGGHGGNEGGGDAGLDDSNLSDGSVAGGATGAEHFTHDPSGYWGVDGKVLRR